MAKRIIIFPYKMGSKSARDLANTLKRKIAERSNELQNRVIRVRSNGNYIPRSSDIVINWGSANLPQSWNIQAVGTFLNHPESVSLAVNKLKTLTTLSEADVRHVPFTTDKEVANRWETVVERHLLRANGGRGINIQSGELVGSAPLYTEYLHGAEEYRVHVFNGKVIDYVKKVKQIEDGLIHTEPMSVKNHVNGWYFLRDVSRRSGVEKRALLAIQALGLDFGAVDVLRWNNKSYVLEVNTACGMSEMALNAYADNILALLQEETDTEEVGDEMVDD